MGTGRVDVLTQIPENLSNKSICFRVIIFDDFDYWSQETVGMIKTPTATQAA